MRPYTLRTWQHRSTAVSVLTPFFSCEALATSDSQFAHRIVSVFFGRTHMKKVNSLSGLHYMYYDSYSHYSTASPSTLLRCSIKCHDFWRDLFVWGPIGEGNPTAGRWMTSIRMMSFTVIMLNKMSCIEFAYHQYLTNPTRHNPFGDTSTSSASQIPRTLWNLTTVRHLPLSWSPSIQSTPFHRISLTKI